MSTVDSACEEALAFIDNLGDPKKMSKQEWVEFLGTLEGDLASRREAAEQELEDEK